MGFFSSSPQYTTIKKDALANDVNAAGKSGIDMLRSGADQLNESFYSNPTDYVDSQISSENRLLRVAADDATKRTRNLMAQRGLGTSSIGLGQEVNQARNLKEKMALNTASGMDRIRGLLNEKLNTGTQLFNVKTAQGPLQMTDLKYRAPTTSSGKAVGQVVGGVAGAYFGGPAGAQAGAQIGGQLAE